MNINEKQAKNILEYKVTFPYFGDFSARKLSDAHRQVSTFNGDLLPSDIGVINIGKIDGDVICNAIWHEMSYNPIRFGSVSPFVFNGRNNIYRFCNGDDGLQYCIDAQDLICKIRKNLTKFLSLNARSNGQWNDEISTFDGKISIAYDSLYYVNNAYSMLAVLRDTIKMIARQNVKDLSKKRGPYRAQILDVASKRHPDGLRRKDKTTVAPIETDISVEDDSERLALAAAERCDDMMDSLQITRNNQRYISPELYQQAKSDYDALLSGGLGGKQY